MRYLIAIVFMAVASAASAQVITGAQNFGQQCPGAGALCNPRVCTYPLPSGSNTVSSAYGFRRLRSAYSGKAINIVRASDSTTTDIGFDPDYCDSDIASMTTFCAGTTCKIVTWYDQSGNGADVTQGTNSKRPGLTISCLQGKPCAAFASASSQELTGTLTAGITNATHIAVASMTDLSGGYEISTVGSNVNGTVMGYSTSSVACVSGRAVAGSIQKGTKVCSSATPYAWVGILQNSSARSRIYLNGSIGTDSTIPGTVTSQTAMNIGSSNAANFFKGNIEEVILFNTAVADADALVVSANQQSYWGISR